MLNNVPVADLAADDFVFAVEPVISLTDFQAGDGIVFSNSFGAGTTWAPALQASVI